MFLTVYTSKLIASRPTTAPIMRILNVPFSQHVSRHCKVITKRAVIAWLQQLWEKRSIRLLFFPHLDSCHWLTLEHWLCPPFLARSGASASIARECTERESFGGSGFRATLFDLLSLPRRAEEEAGPVCSRVPLSAGFTRMGALPRESKLRLDIAAGT